ncbi:DMT family transporter [Oleidesulfovibrio alaskensis]|uniref:DMT family transporter n=1 Tax=Oleidesulfovibrio alaskensis TaxID=58180 RepID=UPI0003FCFB65|nr:DMT family transporter [Oleidesulfovibrio alaskensis]
MSALLFVMALLAGATLPTQAGINSGLQAHWAGSPVLASLVSFSVGTAALVCWCLVTRTAPAVPVPGTTQWWHWTGGLLGAFFVSAVTFLAPRLGATTMVALILAGQVTASVLLDHFGVLGYQARSVNLPRLAGLVMVGAGVYLIRRF